MGSFPGILPRTPPLEQRTRGHFTETASHETKRPEFRGQTETKTKTTPDEINEAQAERSVRTPVLGGHGEGGRRRGVQSQCVDNSDLSFAFFLLTWVLFPRCFSPHELFFLFCSSLLMGSRDDSAYPAPSLLSLPGLTQTVFQRKSVRTTARTVT